jgi:hypothetical protein
MKTAKHEQSTTAEIDRRAHVRVKLNTPIVARRIGGGDTFTVEEASLAGFSIKSPVRFEPESTHHFRLSNSSGQVAIIEAICRYCTARDAADPPSHLVGFQFLPQPSRRLRLILGAIAIDAP